MIRNIPNTTYQILKRVRYFITKTRRRKILVFLLALLVLFTSIRLIFFAPSDIEAAWSPTHNAWARRKRLTITNDSTDSLASGTAVAVSIDTKELYQLGKLQEDCDDIRIVHQPNSSTYTNLDRYLSVPGGVSCSTSGATKVYFQLQAALASAASSSDYYLYYDNDQATTPANSDNAFDIGSKDALLVCPFDGSTTCAASESPSTETGAIRYSGSKSALSFDGFDAVPPNVDYVTSTDSGLDNLLTDNTTIEFWAFWQDNGIQEVADTIIAKDWNVYFQEGTGRVVFWGDCATQDLNYWTDTGAVNYGEWNHIAATFDLSAGTAKIFINGTEETSFYNEDACQGGYNDDSDQDFWVGRTNNVGNHFPGIIDEVRLSNVIRYESNFTPTTVPFVRDDFTALLYHFDEAGNDPRGTTVAFDDSGNGYDGTIAGAQYVTGLVGVNNGTSDTGKADGGNAYAGHEGVFIEEATTNKVTNPSFEHSTYDTNWTASASATLSQNTTNTFIRFGSNSAKLDSAGTRYTSDNNSNNQGLYIDTNSKQLAQGFQIPTSHSPSTASLFIRRIGTASRYVRVEIQTDSSGVPSGTPVTNGTSNCVDYASITTSSSHSYHNFTFATPPSLTVSTQYHLVLRSFTDSGCGTEQSSADGTNYITWDYDSSSATYSSGDRATMNESSTWSTQTDEDHIFAISTVGSLLTTINPGNTNDHTLSAYVYAGYKPAAAIGEAGGEVDATVAKLVFDDASVSTTYTDMGGGMWRLSYAAGPSGISADFGVEVQTNQIIYVDGLQLEENSYPTSFAGGSLVSDAGGDNTYFWDDDCDGTLDAGEDETADQNTQCSTRIATRLEYDNANFNDDTGSVSLWYKPNYDSSDMPNTVWPRLFYVWENASNAYRLLYASTNDRWHFQKTTSTGDYYAFILDTYSVNEWIHVVATWDITNGIALYINNGTPDTDSNTSAPTITTADIQIGSNMGTSQHADGTISDFRIYDDPLTAAEIADLYYAGLVAHSEQYEVDRFSGEKGQDPVAVWHFDESYGSTANDSSKYGNDLTLYNSPSWNTDSVGARANLIRNLEFDGTDDIASRSADLDFNFSNESFSISGWFRHPSSITGTDTILARYKDAGYKVYMNSSGYICAAIDDDSTWTPDDETCSTSDQGSYADSKWHHFEMVKDEDTSLTLYIDAQRVNYDDTIEASGSLNSTSGIFIGADSNNSNLWTGFLDKIVIYPYARTADQVKADVFGSQTSALFGVDPKDWLTDGLVGYWKLDEATNTDRLDSSGNGNTLSESTGDDIDGANGKFANAADFENSASENEYLSITDASQTGLDLGNQFTLATWINLETSTSINPIIAKSGGDGSHSYDTYIGSTNGIRLRLDDDGWSPWDCDFLSDTGLISDNEWVHITITYDGGMARLFLDGEENTSNQFPAACTITPINDTGAYYLGYSAVNSAYLDGKMDEVRTYSRALSPSEVADLYNWAPGPVGYWKLEETSGTRYDSSGYGNNLTDNNTVESAIGKYGKAADFEYAGTSSNENLSIADGSHDGLDITGPITVVGWFNIEDAPEANGGTIAGKMGYRVATNDWAYRLYVRNSDTKPQITLSSTGATADGWARADNAVSTGVWHHAAGVYDGSYVYLYIDGVLATSPSSYSSGINDSAEDFRIGAVGYDGGDPILGEFDGQLDDVRVYNYARTQEQIVEDMNAGHPAPGSPIGSAVLHLKFDEGYGDTAYDSSPQGNDGDFYGSCPGSATCPDWINDGKIGKALSFNDTQTDGLTVADDISLRIDDGEDFSISVWVNRDDPTNEDTILAKRGSDVSGSAGYYLWIDDANDDVNLEVCDQVDEFSVNSRSTITTTGWNHIVAVFDEDDEDNVKIYINGVDDTEGTSGTLSNIGDLEHSDPVWSLRVGTMTGTSNPYSGQIDEVKLYKFALTAAQAKTEYNQGFSQVFGATGTDSSGSGTWSSVNEYCPPGQGSSCTAPIAEWKFDEKTGQSTYDTSENSNTGRLGTSSGSDSGDPTWIHGKHGGALDFDGNNDYVYEATSPLDTQLAYSVSAWIYPRNVGGDRAIHCINSPDFCFYTDSNAALILFNNSTSASSSSSSVSTDEWQHVTVTYDGSSVFTFYVNGVDVTSDSTGGETDSSGNESFIGSYDSASNGDPPDSNWFNGMIDELRIYQYERTQAQIAWEYNRGGPIGWWRLDECSGTVANDAGSGGNNGTIEPGDTSGSNDSVGTCDSGAGDEMWDNGTNGKRNASLDFDGTNDYVNIGDPAELDFGDEDFTVAAWVKADDEGGWYRYVSKTDNAASDNSWMFSYVQGNDRISWQLNDDGTGSGWTSQACMKSGEHEPNTWYFIVGWHDSVNNLMGCKVNNLEVYSRSFSTGVHQGDEPIRIGTEDLNSSFTDGQIDEVKIWNYVLTPQQIRNEYNAGAVYFGPSTGAP